MTIVKSIQNSKLSSMEENRGAASYLQHSTSTGIGKHPNIICQAAEKTCLERILSGISRVFHWICYCFYSTRDNPSTTENTLSQPVSTEALIAMCEQHKATCDRISLALQSADNNATQKIREYLAQTRPTELNAFDNFDRHIGRLLFDGTGAFLTEGSFLDLRSKLLLSGWAASPQNPNGIPLELIDAFLKARGAFYKLENWQPFVAYQEAIKNLAPQSLQEAVQHYVDASVHLNNCRESVNTQYAALQQNLGAEAHQYHLVIDRINNSLIYQDGNGNHGDFRFSGYQMDDFRYVFEDFQKHTENMRSLDQSALDQELRNIPSNHPVTEPLTQAVVKYVIARQNYQQQQQELLAAYTALSVPIKQIMDGLRQP